MCHIKKDESIKNKNKKHRTSKLYSQLIETKPDFCCVNNFFFPAKFSFLWHHSMSFFKEFFFSLYPIWFQKDFLSGSTQETGLVPLLATTTAAILRLPSQLSEETC